MSGGVIEPGTAAGSEGVAAMDEVDLWVSGHLHYHQGLDRAVRGFVRPLVAALAKDRRIEAFFFIRHGLGGPHVRLRLRPAAGAGEAVLEAMRRRARTFLAREPSTRSMEEEAIRNANAYILAVDRHETDDAVYPDNHFRVAPFRPEIERYGGPSRFPLSLDYFTLSSVAALEVLAEHGDGPRSARLGQACGLLLRQALGFAADSQELADLLRYGVDSWGADLPKVVAKGDDVARAQAGPLLRLFSESLGEARAVRTGERPPGLSPAALLVAGAGVLSAAIGSGERALRARIGGSQLHMTASRLGLSPAEEVYLCRLLTLTLHQASAAEGTDLPWLGETPGRRAAVAPAEALGRLQAPALAALGERSR